MIDLASIARALVAPGKGILAADESTGTADKRLAAYGIGTGPEMRQKYRDVFLNVDGIEEYLSGVIFHEETLTQKSDSGTPFAELLRNKGIIPGIKVDQGTEPLPENPDELITNGLIGLPERLAAFKAEHDTGFTKWRAVIKIDGDRLPSGSAIVENGKRLASYARMVQEAGMVPILEPEVLYDGTHSRLRAQEVIQQTVSAMVTALADQSVDQGGIILKTSMAMSGKGTGKIDTPEEVAEATLGALIASLPKGVPGVVFLSGGQGNDQATDNLRAINKAAKEKGAPWPLTFSYARALQDEGLSIWKGEDANILAAREAYLARLYKVSKAALGE